MMDIFTFRAPLGPLGRLAEALVLTRYMKGLLLTRNRYVKQLAEANIDPLMALSSHAARACEGHQAECDD